MANPYPANVVDGDGTVRLSGQVDFTDAANRPGGATPGAAIVRGPFSFAFNSPGIATGFSFGYTPAVNDIVLDVWVEFITAFNGTSPLLDVGPFTGGDVTGLFAMTVGALLVTSADAANVSGIRNNEHQTNGVSPAAGVWPAAAGNVAFSAGSVSGVQRAFPLRVTSAVPWLVVLSRDGYIGGGSTGATQGSGSVYVVSATPTTS